MHEFFMREALKEAEKAYKKGEVPIGAVLVKDGQIIARAHNESILKNDPTAHAEIQALRKSGKKLKNYRLNDAILYVTIEPCPMCAGALVWARIKKVVFGAVDKRAGSCGTIFSIVDDKNLNHCVEVVSGVCESACKELMRKFFKERR
ncbi:MAG: tRNA adenosine(34) deaminase TadA [Elusimicrobiota bacterium]